MNILLTGPAGYIGSKLLPKLLEEGHYVIGFDNLSFGYHTLIPYLDHKNFYFIKGDIRDMDNYKNMFQDIDGIIHLAAIVGFPACAKEPKLATEVNLIATKRLADLKKDSSFLIYSSTCSNYGHRGTNAECVEKSPLNPLSIYGTTKIDSESYVLKKNNSVALRIATAFGVSPRLRLDLLVNNFIINAIKTKKIEIFESFHRRSFVHVSDIANAFCFAVKNFKIMKNNAFNVGDKNLNVTKLQLAEIVKKYIKCDIVDIEGKDLDQRDYIINFDKINKIGFRCSKTLEHGIKETTEVLNYLMSTNEFNNFKKFYQNI